MKDCSAISRVWRCAAVLVVLAVGGCAEIGRSIDIKGRFADVASFLFHDSDDVVCTLGISRDHLGWETDEFLAPYAETLFINLREE